MCAGHKLFWRAFFLSGHALQQLVPCIEQCCAWILSLLCSLRPRRCARLLMLSVSGGDNALHSKRLRSLRLIPCRCSESIRSIGASISSRCAASARRAFIASCSRFLQPLLWARRESLSERGTRCNLLLTLLASAGDRHQSELTAAVQQH